MSPIQKHFRNAFLAGIFAAIPVGATAFIVWYVPSKIASQITSGASLGLASAVRSAS